MFKVAFLLFLILWPIYFWAEEVRINLIEIGLFFVVDGKRFVWNKTFPGRLFFFFKELFLYVFPLFIPSIKLVLCELKNSFIFGFGDIILLSI